MFETDYTNASNGYSLLPPGKYECTINQVTEDATQSERPSLYIHVDLIIRKDIAQKYGGRHIFYAIWRRKSENQTEDDKKVGGYNFKQLMNLCRAAQIPSGTRFETMNDLMQALRTKNVNVVLEHDTYNGQTREKVKYVNASTVPDGTAPAAVAEPDEVTFTADDDLPF